MSRKKEGALRKIDIIMEHGLGYEMYYRYRNEKKYSGLSEVELIKAIADDHVKKPSNEIWKKFCFGMNYE